MSASRRSRDMTLGEAKLPGGGPADRGISLDDSIPGTKTFVKPLDDNGETEPKDDSIHRVDSPREMGKSPSTKDDEGIDHSKAKPSFNGLGKPQNSPKTKYPYRDNKASAHNASVEFVAALWDLRTAAERVIPAGTRTRVAATMQEMLTGLNPKFVSKAQACTVTMKRADVANMRWIFAVNCGNGAKAVKVKARRKGNVTLFSKMDLHVSCSCPAWQWQGPEFHSTTKSYQDPNTPLQGTASTPDIRDPERQNLVCKHVAAALSFTKTWAVSPKKKG